MSYPFKQARWFHKGRQGIRPIWIVLHDAETAELPTSAEGVADYFAQTDRKASTHLTADTNSVVRSVLDADTAFGAKDANNKGLHIEHAGRAAQTAAEWGDPYSEAMLSHQSAPAVALWCRENAIPARFVDAAGLKRGESGITTHAEVSKAFPSTGHTDPGPNFPISHFLELVRSHLSPAPVPHPPVVTPISTIGDDVPRQQDYVNVPAPSTDGDGDGAFTLPYPFGRVGAVVFNQGDQNQPCPSVTSVVDDHGMARAVWKRGGPNMGAATLIVEHWE